jgi:hypothetical protein
VFSRIFGDASSQVAHSVAFDGAGNIVVAGNFEGTMDLGGGPVTSVVASDLFVAKFDSTGKHLWSKRFGDTAKQAGWAVATDAQDNIFLAGGLTGSVSFGNIVVTAHEDAQWDVFLAKLDPVGNPLWVYHVAAPGGQAFYDIAAGADGAVVAVGDGVNAVDFGGGGVGTDGDWNAIVVKVDANGEHAWSRSFGEEEYQGAWGVAVDSTENVYFTGGLWGPVDFGAGLVSSPDGDGFLVGLDPNGQYRWGKVFGEVGEQYGVRTAVDGMGNVVLTFDYEGTVNLGGDALASHPVLGESGVAKFGPFGQHIWSKRLFNTATKSRDFQVAVDESGNVLLAGATDSSVDFGGGTLASEGEALVVAKLGASGNHLWSKAFGGAGASVVPKDAVASHLGRFVVVGEMQGRVDFGGGTLESAGKTDACLLHLAH